VGEIINMKRDEKSLREKKKKERERDSNNVSEIIGLIRKNKERKREREK